MQNQTQPSAQWVQETTQFGTFHNKIKFLRLNQNFQFKETIIYNQSKLLLIGNGQLIFNNGLTVPITSAHQLLFNKTLNQQPILSKSKVVFSIDQNPQTLVFTSKVLGISNETLMEAWIKEFEQQVLRRRQSIVRLLAVIGLQMESELKIMRQLVSCKRQLKNKLDQILKSPQQDVAQKMISQNTQEYVIKYGPGSIYTIEESKDSLPEVKSQPNKKKRAQGGYFTIQYLDYLITNHQTSKCEKKTLCRKTLREKRQSQDYAHEQNKKKIKKQLLIVNSIKDKRFLLRYFYRGNIDNLDEVLMEKQQYSLQEYIYYYGDCLEIQNKIIIAKQIVEAVLTLHQSGVVHRDIKPSNILIDDSIDYRIKLIDFAESYSNAINFEVGEYGCSCPYSPLECAQKKSTCPEGNREGIVRKQIDYWSVGITIYQLFFRKLPVSFSRAFISDITLSWKNELLLAVNQRPKSGLAVVDDVITVLCIKMIKLQQQKRMNLTKALKILQLLEDYVKSLLNLVK